MAKKKSTAAPARAVKKKAPLKVKVKVKLVKKVRIKSSALKSAAPKQEPEKAVHAAFDENACRAILEEISSASKPLRSREIAVNMSTKLGLRIGRSTINRYLFGPLADQVVKDEEHRWSIVKTKKKSV
ncbi:MAG: hypothetical protein HZC28_09515 [Spirochaetes bacterium]|nr:hypothetical protein [Spirochaetota bacterium]